MSGRLFVVGIGPGGREYLAPRGAWALEQCSDWVGYQGYLELLSPAPAGKRCHPFAIGAERQRAAKALRLAQQGRSVALISSGDAGVFGIAAVLFEVLEEDRSPSWPEIEVVPGVSAVQLAAARLGAPLGQDFCVISLSDLLTPWERIEARVTAAAQADFVVALYNPASRARHWQFPAACALLLRHRSPDTPLILGSRLARPGETLELRTLGEYPRLRPDMHSIVLVGNSATRTLERREAPGSGAPGESAGGVSAWVYTRRAAGGARAKAPAGGAAGVSKDGGLRSPSPGEEGASMGEGERQG